MFRPERENFRLSLYEEQESFVEAMELYRAGEDLAARAHPAVTALRDYDAQYKTAYFETLRVYLQSALKTQLAAETLCIHRNSLEYRLRKIRSLVGLDWENGDLMMRLHRSFVLLRFQELAAERERFEHEMAGPAKH